MALLLSFKNKTIGDSTGISLQKLEYDMTIIDLSTEKLEYNLVYTIKELALVGKVTLDDLKKLPYGRYDVLDLSGAVLGDEDECWEQFLGYRHGGGVVGNSGVKSVDVLKRLLEEVSAVKVILPDNVMKRHINAAIRNECIYSLEVGENCPKFSMRDGNVYNKKGDKLQFEARPVVYATCPDCGEAFPSRFLLEIVNGPNACSRCSVKYDKYRYCFHCGRFFVVTKEYYDITCPECANSAW